MFQHEPNRRVEDYWWHPIVEFTTHVAVGTILFAILALAAVGLHHFTRWLDPPSNLMLFGLTTAEETLFTADIALFLLFIARAAFRAARRLIRSWNE